MLSPKSHHRSAVLNNHPLRDLIAGATNFMSHLNDRCVDHPPACLVHAEAPVHVFAIHEKRLVIQRANLFQTSATHQHRAAAQPVDIDWGGVVKITHQIIGRGLVLREELADETLRKSPACGVGHRRHENCSVPSGLMTFGPMRPASGVASAHVSNVSKPPFGSIASEFNRKT